LQPTMSRPLLLLSVSLLASAASAAFSEMQYKNCNSIFEIKSVEATDCTIFEQEIKGETKKVCLFKSGTKPSIKIAFVPNETGVDGLETSVRAKFGKSTLPYAMTDFETCKHGGIACPLIGSQEYAYTQEFHIDPSYPTGELFQVNWAIGKGEKKHICVVFLAKIE
ncbi:hypothetical protein PMAYCL1PPCAC_03077, partial [Pristionchus mayeri]